MPYYGNYSLAGNPTITHAVVVVHGILRNPREYFTGMLQAVNGAGVGARTMVVAPYFQASEDHPAADEPRWNSLGWENGDSAIMPHGLSSFTVMDHILATLADKARFPHLTWVTVAGHSAGGRFTQRYAAVGRAPSVPGLLVNYVVADPSTYLYLNPYRPDLADPTGQRFTVPSTTCAYDNYEYGLNRPNSYIATVPASAIINQYTTRRVTYLQGGADTQTVAGKQGHWLDTSCAAEIQGADRLQRSALYYNYIRAYFPSAPHNRLVVPNVGHDYKKIFGSIQGRTALFDRPPQA
jgi:pimeloyl-ACP methyl ester carboxylesterase